MNVIFVLLSLILYVFAPDKYSFDFCLGIHTIFLVHAVYVCVKDYKIEKFSFNLLFTISFYFVNFVYPVFVYPIDPDYSLMGFNFNHSVISKCTALAYVAYAIYAYGYTAKRYNLKTSTDLSFAINNSILMRYYWLLIFLIFVFFISGGLTYHEDRYLRGVMSANLVVQYTNLLMCTIILTLSILAFSKNGNILKKNPLISATILLIVLLLLLSGSRTFPLSVLSLLFAFYCRTYKVSFVGIIGTVLLGVVLFSIVGQTRGSGVSLEVANTVQYGHWWEYTTDLFINNRNLYVAYDYVENFTITYGLTLLGSLLAPIPLMQSFICNLFGISTIMTGSASFITYLEFGNNPPLGLGTNIVADIYLAFGFIGVLLLFGGLGWLVNFLRYKYSTNNLYAGIAYFILLSDAIYMCRSSMFGSFRMIAWGIFLVFIVNKYIKRKEIT